MPHLFPALMSPPSPPFWSSHDKHGGGSLEPIQFSRPPLLARSTGTICYCWTWNAAPMYRLGASPFLYFWVRTLFTTCNYSFLLFSFLFSRFLVCSTMLTSTKCGIRIRGLVRSCHINFSFQNNHWLGGSVEEQTDIQAATETDQNFKA